MLYRLLSSLHDDILPTHRFGAQEHVRVISLASKGDWQWVKKARRIRIGVRNRRKRRRNKRTKRRRISSRGRTRNRQHASNAWRQELRAKFDLESWDVKNHHSAAAEWLAYIAAPFSRQGFPMPKWYVFWVRSEDGAQYAGVATDVARRFA